MQTYSEVNPMSKKQDPRTVQTKVLIKQTLLDMMKKTAFEKITVSELCKIAEINRGTFYLHYCDLRHPEKVEY